MEIGKTGAVRIALALLLSASACSGEVLWPRGRLSPTSGVGVTLDRRPKETIVTVGVNEPHVWPAVYFTAKKPFDLSKATSLLVTITNRTSRQQSYGIKVKGITLQGGLPEDRVSIQPFAARTKRIWFFMEGWVFDKPCEQLVGLKRTPVVGNGSTFSLDKATAVSVYVPAGTRNTEFGVLRIETDQTQRIPPRTLHADTFMPWVDAFGQARHADWPEKVRSVEDLRRRDAQEARELAAQPDAFPEVDRFGGWAKGPKLRASGTFRTEKLDGKWWLVDPDGHLFFANGVNYGWNLTSTPVTHRESYFEKLPPKTGETEPFWTLVRNASSRRFYSDPTKVPYWAFSFSAHDLWLKYGADWRNADTERMVKRMRAWGVNAVVNGPSAKLRAKKAIPYMMEIGPSSRPIAGAKGYWGNLSDPFAPEFAESCRKLAEAARPAGTSEWCLGWTANNEQSWGDSGALLARSVLASPDDQPAKVALLKMLKDRGKDAGSATDEDLRSLGEAVADRYYSTVRAAIKAVAPNHLYMGDRNAQLNPEVFRAASRHCDVITVNTYDYRPTVSLPAGSEDCPLMVTEFHFGCYDTGYFYASLVPVKDQKTRAECCRNYLLAAVDDPNYVGANWFQWRDCPISGTAGEDANAQCGLVSTADVPYEDLVKAIKGVAREMYPRRLGRRR